MKNDEKPKRRMSPASLANLRPVKPGEVLNPKGNTNTELRRIRQLTVIGYGRVIELAMTSNLTELKALMNDKEATAIELGVVTSLVKAIERGDVDVFERLASRIVGKIPDKIQIEQAITVSVSFDDREKLRATMAKLRADV